MLVEIGICSEHCGVLVELGTDVFDVEDVAELILQVLDATEGLLESRILQQVLLVGCSMAATVSSEKCGPATTRDILVIDP